MDEELVEKQVAELHVGLRRAIELNDMMSVYVIARTMGRMFDGWY